MKIFFYQRHCHSDPHQLIAAINFSALRIRIIPLRIQTQKPKTPARIQRIKKFLKENRDTLSFCDDGPHNVILIRHIMPIESRVKKTGAFLYMFQYLQAYLCFFFLRTFCKIQFIPKVKKPCCLVSCVKRSDPSCGDSG